MPPPNDDKLQAALTAADEDLKEIIRIAQADNMPADELHAALTSSGFALGWQAAALKATPSSTSYSLLQTLLSRLDDALLQGNSSADDLAVSRNLVAAEMVKQRDAHRATALAYLTRVYGDRAANLLLQESPLSDDDAFVVGMEAYGADRGLFWAYISGFGDPGIPCQCPGHLMEALVKKGETPGALEARLSNKYTGRLAALPAFGRWLAGHTALTLRFGDMQDSPQQVDPQAAGDELSALLARFHGGPPSTEGNGSD